jgi:hypothetical protein
MGSIYDITWDTGRDPSSMPSLVLFLLHVSLSLGASPVLEPSFLYGWRMQLRPTRVWGPGGEAPWSGVRARQIRFGTITRFPRLNRKGPIRRVESAQARLLTRDTFSACATVRSIDLSPSALAVHAGQRKAITFTSSPPYGEVTSKDSLIIQSTYIKKTNLFLR